MRVEWRSASAVFVLPQKQIVERRIYQREGVEWLILSRCIN